MEELEQFLNLIEEFKTSVFNFNAACGIIAGIVVLILEIIWLQKYERKDRRKEKFLKRGHVVHAKRVNMWDDRTPGSSENSQYNAKYNYQVSGKTYVYRYLGTTYPPNDITLYYMNNPRRVWTDFEKKMSPFAIFLYLIPLAVAIIVFHALGGV